MQKADLLIQNEHGLHARPAANFVATAQQFTCDLVLVKGDKRANAKSVLSLMTLSVKLDEMVTIEADGPDEADAIRALLNLAANNFDVAV